MRFISFFLATMLCVSCARNEQSATNTDTKRTKVTTVEVVNQQIQDGQIIELRTKTKAVEKETTVTDADTTSRVEVEAPKVLTEGLKTAAKAAADALIGPAGSAAVEGVWQIVAGVAGLGAAAGTGAVIRTRERNRTRKLVKAQDDFARDLEEAETDDDVEKVKKKHAERQDALGIRTELTRERHGA